MGTQNKLSLVKRISVSLKVAKGISILSKIA